MLVAVHESDALEVGHQQRVLGNELPLQDNQATVERLDGNPRPIASLIALEECRQGNRRPQFLLGVREDVIHEKVGRLGDVPENPDLALEGRLGDLEGAVHVVALCATSPSDHVLARKGPPVAQRHAEQESGNPRENPFRRSPHGVSPARAQSVSREASSARATSSTTSSISIPSAAACKPSPSMAAQ